LIEEFVARPDPNEVDEFADEEEESIEYDPEAELLDLDKSWHGIHYLLSGSDFEGEPPQAFLLNWGIELGDPDAPYGSTHAYTAAQTAEIDLVPNHHNQPAARTNDSQTTLTNPCKPSNRGSGSKSVSSARAPTVNHVPYREACRCANGLVALFLKDSASRIILAAQACALSRASCARAMRQWCVGANA